MADYRDIAWDVLTARAQEFEHKLLASDLDAQQRTTISKELSALSNLLTAYKQVESLGVQLKDLDVQRAQTHDAEYLELIDQERESLKAAYQFAIDALEQLLYPPDEQDNRSVFVEIRAGTGGQEAALFAGDLARMYTLYGDRKRCRVSVTSQSETDLGGYRDMVLHIEGKSVHAHLKHESGVHRVQRVPATETAGRIHTSTATVAVFPEAEEVEYSINPNDLRIDVYRASGAGGQHVNTTDSAVSITHIPTGVVVACQDERSQHKNKAKALKMLQARLYAAHKEKQDAQMAAQRKEQVGSAQRSEKVRTYNYPQTRVTDHQVNVTLSKLDRVMEGDLDDIIEPLMKMDLENRRKTSHKFLYS